MAKPVDDEGLPEGSSDGGSDKDLPANGDLKREPAKRRRRKLIASTYQDVYEDRTEREQLLSALKRARNLRAHVSGDTGGLVERIVQYTLDEANKESERNPESSGSSFDFDFTAVGSVDNALATARPFTSEPVLRLVSEARPHDLAALKEQSISPQRLGFEKPDGFSDEEFENVVSSYAGAELLDRERQFNEVQAERAHARENRKMILQITIPIVTFALGLAAAYFGLRS